MVDENYAEHRDLVWMAVDGICRVLEMQGPTPRADFCRLLAKEGLLEPLSHSFVSVLDDEDDLAQSAASKIAYVVLQFSQSDMRVRLELANRPVALREADVLQWHAFQVIAAA